MRHAYFLPLTFALGLSAFPSQVFSQEQALSAQDSPAVVSTTPKERLQQLQDTFNQNASALHRPLLLEYLQQLKLLRTRLESAGKLAELSQVQLEIEDTEIRLQKHQGFNLEIKTSKSGEAPNSRRQRFEPKFVLNADQAKGMPTGAATVPLGKAQWQFPSLEPGHYQISVTYAPPSTTNPTQVRWMLPNKVGVATLAGATPSRTSSPYHAQVLGELHLEDSNKDGLFLQLENANAFAPALHVRHIVISQAIAP